MKDLIEALTIFSKYTDSMWPTCCAHDVLYVGVDPAKVSEEDIQKLEKLGFDPDEEIDCFRSYKFGSY